MAHFTLSDRPLYDPALIQRSDDGQFWHPDLPFPEGAENSGDEYVDITGALQEQGFNYTMVEAPEDVVGDNLGDDAFWARLRAWEPELPEGDGWLLACIADGENGPAAWFVRPIT